MGAELSVWGYKYGRMNQAVSFGRWLNWKTHVFLYVFWPVIHIRQPFFTSSLVLCYFIFLQLKNMSVRTQKRDYKVISNQRNWAVSSRSSSDKGTSSQWVVADRNNSCISIWSLFRALNLFFFFRDAQYDISFGSLSHACATTLTLSLGSSGM